MTKILRTVLMLGFALTGCQCQSTTANGTGTTSAGSSATGTGTGTGTSGTATTGSTSGVSNACGLNSSECDGRCTVTLTDPDNCGGCGVKCAQDQVCVGAMCVASADCPEGTVACGGSCIDPDTDSQACGGCADGGDGSACPAGQGCAGGICVTSIILDGGAPACPAGGQTVASVDGGAPVCTGNLAQVTFRWALCSCADIHMSAPLITDGFNSLQGAYMDGGPGGGVGANGSFGISSTADVGGSLWIDGTSTFAPSSQVTVGDELHVNASVHPSSGISVDADAYVNGNAQGQLAVGGTLFVPSTATVASSVQATSVVTGPVTVPPPCDCAPSQLIDVAGIVLAGQAHNDDATLGLDPMALASGGERLDLPCGQYYLSSIGTSAPTAIVVHGPVVLFIGGDFRPSAPLEITLDPQATLDIFIGGNLQVSAPLQFGSTLVPRQTRVYVAGSQVSISSTQLIAANFYLPFAAFGQSAPLSIYGSVFAGSYSPSAMATFHYDSAILSAGSECTDGGTLPADGGTGCQSCRDCFNQACVQGQCGGCTDSSQCCAPLVCSVSDAGGVCIQQLE